MIVSNVKNLRAATVLRQAIRVTMCAVVVGGIGLVSTMAATPTAPVQEPANVGVFDKLVVRFDADHDRSLSAAEQSRLIAHVGQTYGPRWSERTQAWLKEADADGDGSISEAEWRQFRPRLAEKLKVFSGKQTSPTADAGPGKSGKETAKQPAKEPKQAITLAAGISKRSFQVPMSDGAKLATDVYLLPGAGPFPVLLMRTPYPRDNESNLRVVDKMTRAGLAFVVQSMRGCHGSEGEHIPFIACGWGEHRDGVETLAWIHQQSWCNGKVGTMGGSAMGFTQNLLAGCAPDGLTAQHITFCPASAYHQSAYTGGAYRKSQFDHWATSYDPKALATVLAHPSYDAYWRDYDTTLKHAEMNVPALHHGGWFDVFTQGTIEAFLGRQHYGAPGAKGKQKLVLGAWHHAGSDHGMVGELSFPNHTVPPEFTPEHWFEYYLKGVDNGLLREPAVAYYVMGDVSDPRAPGNCWRTANDWPPLPSRDMPYYFATDNSLTPQPPVKDGTGSSRFLQFTFDPDDPCPTIGGRNLTIARGPRNQNPLESRPDVLLFTTPPLTAPLEVTGRVLAKLYVSSSAVDTDVSVRLCDVYPDGKSYLFTEGMLRLRYRDCFEEPHLLRPGEIVPVTVDCWSLSLIFNKGHRIRVAVTSSNFPRYDLNPGTGKPWQESEQRQKQENRIYCDIEHPSCIVLPVVAHEERTASD